MDRLKRNVLIFHSGALGDFIVTWPLAVALGRLWPQSRIIYVTAFQKGELARRAIGVEAADIEGGWHQLFGAGADVNQVVRQKLNDAHGIFSFVSDCANVWTETVRQIAPEAQLLCIQPRPREFYPGHITQFIIDQLNFAPLVGNAMAHIVQSLTRRPIAPVALEPSRIVIHPGAGSADKCWPAEKYLSLIQQLGRNGNKIRVVLGEVERDRWPAERLEQFNQTAEVHWPTTYVELLEELRYASVFIGNDSGPAHLAGIIGVPTITLFGQDNSRLWKPLGPRVSVLQRPFAELSVDEVLANIPIV